MSASHGRFVWYELMTTDTAGAAAFYSHVVGWTARDSGMPGLSYTLFYAGEAMRAGMMAIPEESAGMPPAWIGSIHVDDVDATAARLVAAGGTVHRPAWDIPGVGRLAVVADPQGAVFYLFRGSDEPTPAPEGMPGVREICWHELMTSDPEAGFAFYADLFGWTKGEAYDMGEGGTYQLFAAQGRDVGGIEALPPGVPQPCWLYYIAVEDIDAAVARVAEAGGTLLLEPMAVPGEMWIVQGRDPQGGVFALLGPRP